MLSHVAQNNFTAGELSEWLDPRVDFVKYNNGLSLCENAIVRPQGGVFGRPGTKFVAPTKYNDRTTRLIPFRFSKTQTYIIEMGHEYMRFYYNYAPITNVAYTIDGSGTYATSGTDGNLIVGADHDIGPNFDPNIEGYAVILTGAAAPQANGRYTITNAYAGGVGVDGKLELDGPTFTTEEDFAGATVSVVYEIATNYQAEDLRGIKYAQYGDTLYLVHEDYQPAKLQRLSHTLWELNIADFQDGPYFDTNTTTVTLDPSADTGAITVTASSALFNVLHEGSIWRYSDAGTNWGYFEITDFTSSTSVSATVIQQLPGGANPPASAFWREGMWSDLQGYPAAVTFHEQSSIWGGSPGAPQTFVKSVSDSPEDMTPGTLDDDAAVYTIGSGEIDSIRWLKSVEYLIAGTEGNEIAITGNNDEALTPTSVRIKPRTPHGSNVIDAVRVSDAVVFCQRTGKRVRALSYQVQTDKYTAKDLGMLADHILETHGLADMAYQQERHSILWGVRDDGELIGITYLPDEEVIAWHRHPSPNNAAFQSVATVPSPTFDRDDVWVTVVRTMDGGERQFVEYLEPSNDGLDSALTFTDAATTFRLQHLRNQVVSCVSNGVVYTKTVDNDGLITFSTPVSNLRVGLRFTGRIRTMKPETQLPGGGTTQGLPRRWAEVRVRVKDTVGLTIAGDQMPYRKQNDPMDTAVSAFSGDHIVDTATSFDDDGRLLIEQTTPLPWAVTGIFGKVEYGVD